MPVPINITVPALFEFNKSFLEYIRVTKKMPNQVVAEKSEKLRHELRREFDKHTWKSGRKGGAKDESDLRFIMGEGTEVRQKIKDKVRAGTAYDFSKLKKKRKTARAVDKNGKPLYGQRLAVWLEVRRRSQGVGYLQASLLDKRYRKPPKGKPFEEKRLVVNHSGNGKVLTVMDLRPGEYRIEMFAQGASVVDQRYGVANAAIAAQTADMNVYLTRKADEAKQSTLGKRYAA